MCLWVDYPPSLRPYSFAGIAYILTPLTSGRLLLFIEEWPSIPLGGLKGETAPSAMPTLAGGAFLLEKNN